MKVYLDFKRLGGSCFAVLAHSDLPVLRETAVQILVSLRPRVHIQSELKC